MKRRMLSFLLALVLILTAAPVPTLAAEETADDRDYAWNPVPPAIRAYLEQVTYDPADTSVSRIGEFAPSYAESVNLSPMGQGIPVPDGTVTFGGYEQTVSAGTATLFNAVPNRATTYTVRSASGAVTQSGTLYPNGCHLRMIRCPTAVNLRDLGGWACDGGTVRYGKLFRGGNLTEADRDVILNQLGVRHELDLRGREEAAGMPSVLRDAIGYSVFDSCAWYDLSNTALWRQMLRVVFDCVKTGQPVLFHCSAGADRTGTLACVLEALLGMSRSDIDKDYELTCFATGTGTDARARRRNEPDWNRLIQALNGKTGDTFRDKAVSFVLELGFSLNEINAFRAAMIDGTPEILTPLADQTPVSTPAPVQTPRPTQTGASPFADVPAGQYYSDAVLWAVRHNPQITTGTTETTFSPDAGCTRGQTVTFLWRAAGCPKPVTSIRFFADVKSGDYFDQAVIWAAENEITNGTGKDLFSPNAPVTRAQTVTFLWRMMGAPRADVPNPFRDVGADAYYADAVLWAVQQGVTNGTSGVSFSPDHPCTRAQIVTFLYRALTSA